MNQGKYKTAMIYTIILGLMVASQVVGSVPATMSYQGLLTNSDGAPVADGDYSVTFTVYDADVGVNSKWTETQLVTTTDGLFSVLLGTVNPITDSVFADTSRYLGIKVESDPELTPRSKLVTAPYAYHVATIDGASGGNLTSDVSIGAEPFNLGGGVYGNLFMGGTIGFKREIGPSSGHPMLIMYPSDTSSNPDRMIYQRTINSTVGLMYRYAQNRFDFTVGSGTPALSVDLDNFRVGINNISPAEALDVSGVVKASGGVIGSGASISGLGSFIAANNSTITGNWASCVGGQFNVVNSDYAWIIGGRNCDATGIYSVAGGVRAKAIHDGAFVWADSTADLFTTDFTSTAVNQFSVRCRGGARFVSAIDGSSNPIAGVELAAGGGAWTSISDSTLKRNVREVDYQGVLTKVAELPISQWSYKSQDESIEHIGPMAQDLFRLFGLGEDDRHINSLDPDGISLAAIKALIEKNKELENEISDLKRIVNELIESTE